VGELQRWLCRDCGYRFSEAKPLQENLRCHINTAGTIVSRSQVCDLLTEGSKNLTEQPQLKGLAGATELTWNAKGKIMEFGVKLANRGSPKTTIESSVTMLKTLVRRGADLQNPETIKEIVASAQSLKDPTKALRDTTKRNYIDTYDLFCRTMGIQWEKPRYKQSEKIHFIPEEKEIDQLIYGSGKKLGTALRMAKETAARIGEIVRTRWTDVDFKNKTISISDPEKGSKAGIYRVSDELMSMISSLPKTSDRLFPTSTKPMVTRLCRKRRQLANTYNNPRLTKISFHVLRHWKATMLYHETHDILYVKEFLRHRNIENTMIYITLERQIFQIGDNRGFHVKVAKTIEEACELAKAGFEKFDEFPEGKIYRKRE